MLEREKKLKAIIITSFVTALFGHDDGLFLPSLPPGNVDFSCQVRININLHFWCRAKLINVLSSGTWYNVMSDVLNDGVNCFNLHVVDRYKGVAHCYYCLFILSSGVKS